MKKLFTFCLALVTSVSLALSAVPEDHFRFISNQDGSSVGLAQLSSHQTLEYSLDGNTWNNMTTETTFSLTKDVVLYVRGKLADNNSESNYTKFNITGSVESSGNINYIWDYENLNAPLKQWCGYKLFYECAGLVSAPQMPSMTLATGCYDQMFRGCSLTTAPELPATKLASYCYVCMFMDNTTLTSVPELPATEIADRCYNQMFRGCTNITTPPVLPATTVYTSCYYQMFMGCTKLTRTPELPAEVLASYCYFEMFRECTSLSSATTISATTLAEKCCLGMFMGCTSLTTAPELPATQLAEKCYYGMFQGCTKLTKAPSLPAATLANACYCVMFQGCTALSTAPKLPARTLATNCYRGMFQECSALTNPPVLSATELADTCYRSMFYHCTSLVTAPSLPAQNLKNQCYYAMFQGCSKLNYIRCFAKNISPSQCTAGWFSGVASSGSFVKHSSMSSWTTGGNGIPSGWTTQSVTPHAIRFYANGGEIPANGKMGNTPSPKDITWLSLDQSNGFVFVYETSTSFDQMRNDCPTRAGHTFLGWYTAETGGTQVYDNVGIYKVGSYWDSNGKWIGTADLKLYAQWSVNSYTITWLQDDGSLIDKTTVLYGQIPTHVAPTKEPTAEYTYTFAGWAPTIVPVTDNATYIATYTAQQIPTSLNKVEDSHKVTKILRDGQVFILRGDKTYTLTGEEVK